MRTAQALAAHAQWKETLREAIERGNCNLRPDAVAADDRCELGTWLAAIAAGPAAADPQFLAIRAEHRRFHEHAANVLRLALAGHAKAALRALEGEYAILSAELADLLRDWQAP